MQKCIQLCDTQTYRFFIDFYRFWDRFWRPKIDQNRSQKSCEILSAKKNEVDLRQVGAQRNAGTQRKGKP